MNIFFDVDGTIVNGMELTLRPFVREVFERLNSDGHTIYIWSGVGLRWYDVDRHGLRAHIKTCYVKPTSDHRTSLERLGVEVEPDFVVDDHPEVVAAFGGYTVTPWVRDPLDREMLAVYEGIRLADASRARVS